MNISPTESADPVARKTRMPAARSVRAVPIVDTSWADQSRRKSRLRKTEKAPGPGPAGSPSAGSIWGGVSAVSTLTLAESVTVPPSQAPSRGPHLPPGRASVAKHAGGIRVRLRATSVQALGGGQPNALDRQQLALDR